MPEDLRNPGQAQQHKGGEEVLFGRKGRKTPFSSAGETGRKWKEERPAHQPSDGDLANPTWASACTATILPAQHKVRRTLEQHGQQELPRQLLRWLWRKVAIHSRDADVCRTPAVDTVTDALFCHSFLETKIGWGNGCYSISRFCQHSYFSRSALVWMSPLISWEVNIVYENHPTQEQYLQYCRPQTRKWAGKRTKSLYVSKTPSKILNIFSTWIQETYQKVIKDPKYVCTSTVLQPTFSSGVFMFL